jgi:SH3-like domain-containing protein
MSKALVLVIINLIWITAACAVPKNLPIPRFVTIKFDEANARTGPVNDCPIEWVFVKKGEPVEVIAEYEQWRKIRDIKGEGGWVHSSVISGKRSVVIVAKNTMPLLEAPGKYDQIVAKLVPQIRCGLHQCKKDWCQVSCKSYKGWVARKFLWGIYPDENR